MKNLILTVIFLLSVSFTFANNNESIVNNEKSNIIESNITLSQSLNNLMIDSVNGTCVITVTYYNSDGTINSQYTFYHYNVSEAECERIAESYRKQSK